MSSDTARRLRDSVKWFIVSEELLGEGDVVVAAVSGGADSMALASVLHALGEEQRFRVAAAYLDHGMRKMNERAFVESFALDLGIPFYSGRVDVPALAKASGDSLEEAARRARYAFLHDVGEQLGATHIATGHTQDDQAETVMMRVLRGTGVRGLAGIPVRRGRIVRPLLCLNREDTVAYCRALEIEFVEDPTNHDTRFLRNRIRHELLPLLDANYLGGVRGNLLRLAENAQDVVKSVRERTQPLIAQNLKRGADDEWVLNFTKIAKLDATALFVLFGDLFTSEVGCDEDLSRANYEDLMRLIRDARGSGKALDLPGVSVKREYENLIIRRRRSEASPQLIERSRLTLPGETQAAGMVIETEILERSMLENASMKASDCVAYFDLQRLRLPLTLRQPEKGDRMQPFGMSGSKKLSDIFVDRKIPGRKRGGACVIEDADEILWLVGVTTAEKCRIAPETDKIVRISIQTEDARA